jgi:hypothetical protein
MNAQKSYTRLMAMLCPLATSTTPKRLFSQGQLLSTPNFLTQTFFSMMKPIKMMVIFCCLFFATHTIWGQTIATGCGSFPYSGANGSLTISSLTNVMLDAQSQRKVQVQVNTPGSYEVVVGVQFYQVVNGSITIPNIKIGTHILHMGFSQQSTNTWCSTATWQTVTVTAPTTTGGGTTTTGTTTSLCSDIYTNCPTTGGQLSIGLKHFGGDTSYKLFVNGGIKATKIKVELPTNNGTTWPDYVFDPTYNLLPLSKVEQFIQNNHHLPNMPSANELQKDGVDLLGIITKQQEKIEELYLHIIALEKAIQSKK